LTRRAREAYRILVFWSYAYRSLLARFRTNVISMLSVCLFILGGTIGLSYYASLRNIVRAVPANNIIVVAKSAAAEGDSRVPLETSRKVLLIDGIKKENDAPLAVRELVSRVFVSESFGKFEPASTIRGIDEKSLTVHNVQLVEGTAPQPRSLEMIVGKRVAEQYPHLKVGYEMPLPGGPSRVSGIFTADGSSFEDEIWTAKAALELHINQRGTSSLTLVAEDSRRIGEIIDKINTSKELDVHAATVAEFRADGVGLATIVRTVMVLLLLLAIVAIFAIATTMSSAVAIRMPELAALAAIGVRRGVLGRIILLEGALLGLFGGLLGMAVSAIVITQIGYIPLGTNPIAISLSPIALMMGLGLGLLAGVIGGIAPAIRVRRLDILTAMR
jgi:putative ABC transport system permease protein